MCHKQTNAGLAWEGARGLAVRTLWVWTHGPSATLREGVEESRPAGGRSGGSGGLAP